jgi:Rieske Fe-S protein
MNSMTRRDFLKLTTQGALWLGATLGLAGIARFLSYEAPQPPPRRFELGDAENYPPGSRTVIPQVPAFLVHDDAGFSATRLVCTHLGCTVQPMDGGGFECPCHGSRYASDGSVLSGPAASSLESLHVEITSDKKVVIYQA